MRKEKKRAMIYFKRDSGRKEKNVPLNKAFSIAMELKEKTGKPVFIRLN